jgi:DNA-binding YbaB/EbfC family protein
MTGGFSGFLKQAQQMQSKIGELQKELEGKEIEITSGGGAIKISINGKQEIKSISLLKDCVDPNDIGTLEEIIKIGMNKAIKESQEMVSTSMSKVTAGLNLPGLF